MEVSSPKSSFSYHGLIAKMELDYVTEENFFCDANGSLQKGTNAAPYWHN